MQFAEGAEEIAEADAEVTQAERPAQEPADVSAKDKPETKGRSGNRF